MLAGFFRRRQDPPGWRSRRRLHVRRPPIEWKPLLRKVARALGRAFLVLVVGLVLAEIGARLLLPADPFQRSAFREFQPDPQLFWRLRSNLDTDVAGDGLPSPFHVRSNTLGLRGPDRSLARPAGTHRILCLGDSITYGYGVPEEQTYEVALESLLSSAGRRVEVLNGGCPGYSSWQGLQLLQSVGLRYDPDVLILGFIYADPATEAVSDRQRASTLPASLQGAQRFLYHSRLYLHVRREALARQMPTGPAQGGRTRVPRVSVDEFEANLRACARIMQERGGHVVYLNLAKKTDLPDIEKWLDPRQDRYDRYRETIRRVAVDTGNVYVDCDRLLAQDGRFFLDPIHPNGAGFKVMANAVADALLKTSWLR